MGRNSATHENQPLTEASRSTAATRGQGRELEAREAAELTAQLRTQRRFLVPHNVTRTQMIQKRNMNK